MSRLPRSSFAVLALATTGLIGSAGLSGCASSGGTDPSRTMVTATASVDEAGSAVERAFAENNVVMDEAANNMLTSLGLGSAAGAKVYRGEVRDGPTVVASIARGGERGRDVSVNVITEDPDDLALEQAIARDIRDALGGTMVEPETAAE